MSLEEKVAFIEGMEKMTVEELKAIDWNNFHKISESDITAEKIDELIIIYNGESSLSLIFRSFGYNTRVNNMQEIFMKIPNIF